MTPDEMRGVLLEEARRWANEPTYSEAAARWVTFFEQLPEDDPMLVLFAGEYQDADAFRNRARDLQMNRFSVWNMTCNILQKMSQKRAIPSRPDTT